MLFDQNNFNQGQFSFLPTGVGLRLQPMRVLTQARLFKSWPLIARPQQRIPLPSMQQGWACIWNCKRMDGPCWGLCRFFTCSYVSQTLVEDSREDMKQLAHRSVPLIMSALTWTSGTWWFLHWLWKHMCQLPSESKNHSSCELVWAWMPFSVCMKMKSVQSRTELVSRERFRKKLDKSTRSRKFAYLRVIRLKPSTGL